MKLFFRFFICLLFCVSHAHALSTIRDAEIETVLRELANPIFDVAGLTSESVTIYIVNNDDINAFVAGGQNMFFHTGLLQQSEKPDMLVGVMAHEIGHIAGGHLVKNRDEYKSTALKATVGYVLGIAVAAAGQPDVGQAIAHGSGHVATRQLLKYTRSHEEAADQAALSYLDKLKISPKGLVELLNRLYQKETTLYGNLNPYTLTHPLSSERIEFIENHIKDSPVAYSPISARLQRNFKRSVIKLNAFLGSPQDILKKYPESDTSTYARYSRAIAYYKLPNIDKSISEITALVNSYPNDPYFNELKGQILFENGKVSQSIPFYQKAADLYPESDLIKVELAVAQIASEKPNLRKKAVTNLQQAVHGGEKDNGFAWRQLAIAYGKNGDLGMSNVALAEEALLAGKKDDVQLFVQRARDHIKAGTPADLRLNDIIDSLNRNNGD